MTFKKEISIDGVAVIVSTVGLIVWLANIHFTQEVQAKTLNDHTTQLQSIEAIKISLTKIEARDEITAQQANRINDFEQRIRSLEKASDLNAVRQYTK